MGRAKLKMELIEKEKNRVLTYKKRKEGLMKKLQQLTTLCDVGACMLVDGAAVKQSPGTEIWPPESPDEVHRLIEIYKSKSRELGGVKKYGLSDFFKERQREVEGNLHKLRKKNSESKYPTWNNNLNAMDESQLRLLATALQGKAQTVRSRIELLKMREKQTMMNMVIVDQQVGHTNMMETGCGAGFALSEGPVTYDAFAFQFGQQQYYAPPPPPPYMAWPMSSYAAVQYQSLVENDCEFVML